VYLTNTHKERYLLTNQAQDLNTNKPKDFKRANRKLFVKDFEAYKQGEP
jgi:hypothetical protein